MQHHNEGWEQMRWCEALSQAIWYNGPPRVSCVVVGFIILLVFYNSSQFLWMIKLKFGTDLSVPAQLWSFVATVFPIQQRITSIFGYKHIQTVVSMSVKDTACFSLAKYLNVRHWNGEQGLQARSKDQEILEEGGGAGPSLLPRRDHE